MGFDVWSFSKLSSEVEKSGTARFERSNAGLVVICCSNEKLPLPRGMWMWQFPKVPPGQFKTIITFRVVIPLAMSSAAKDTISSKFERQIYEVECLSNEMPRGDKSTNKVSNTIVQVDVASFHPHENRQNVAVMAADDHQGLATLPWHDILRSAVAMPTPRIIGKDKLPAMDTATKPPFYHPISWSRRRSHHWIFSV